MSYGDPLSSLPPELEIMFWTLLRDTLERVLKADGSLAAQYKAQLESASACEKLLALREDPIDVAATLAGISLTKQHLDRYDEIKGTRRTEYPRPTLPIPAVQHAKIDNVLFGESLVGEGNEVAHIDLLIGPRGSAAETAFSNALTNNKDGFTTLLAVIAPNLFVKPPTMLFNKVTIKNAKQAVQLFGPAQRGVAKAVADSVAEGVIPANEIDNLFISVGVFIHWEAIDDKKIQDYNYQATKEAIARAVKGELRPSEILSHPNHGTFEMWLH